MSHNINILSDIRILPPEPQEWFDENPDIDLTISQVLDAIENRQIDWTENGDFSSSGVPNPQPNSGSNVKIHPTISTTSDNTGSDVKNHQHYLCQCQKWKRREEHRQRTYEK
uniref:Uncharacterized protein LOC114333441 n=1 Tax=Diabrotica virgifera virgifera TaxID=50390 RepID=A0A6P7FRW5_DIAVI